MVSASHNHAGPAVAPGIEFERDEQYVESMVSRVVDAFGHAVENLQDALLGLGSTFEFRVGHNRRVIMRNGTVKTHGTFNDPDALCLEGAIDPEVAVLTFRTLSGDPLGLIVNFTCHPARHGGDSVLSAGYPGVLARIMKERGFPVTLFLNGAAGNIHTSDPTCGGRGMSMEEAGATLADHVSKCIDSITYGTVEHIHSSSTTLQLPFRNPTEQEVKGTVRGSQRFIDPALYDRGMPALLDKIRRIRSQPAEIQVNFIDRVAVAGVPAEYFAQHGFRIKEECYPHKVILAGFTNGMIGYVPHRDAFIRGGYETTFWGGSRMAPETGDIIANCVIQQVKEWS